MIFKQKILKEEIIKFGIILACVIIPYVLILILNFISNNEVKVLVLLFLILLLPIFLLLILIGLNYLEWYYIYDDHIEVKNIYGKKNSVYYNKVSHIEEVEINLTTRGMKKTFYIFCDGRKNNNNMFDINSCYNNKNFNLRIYKTAKLENYIVNILKFKVNVE